MTIKDKIIVITGASKGLGKASALYSSRKGTRVILVARIEPLIGEAQKRIFKISGKAPLVVTCDITEESGVQAMAGSIQNMYPNIAATKHAITGLSDGFRCDLKNRIKVGTLYPGPMKTLFHQNNPDLSVVRADRFSINLHKVTARMEKMILSRARKCIMYRRLLFLMKLKQLMG